MQIVGQNWYIYRKMYPKFKKIAYNTRSLRKTAHMNVKINCKNLLYCCNSELKRFLCKAVIDLSFVVASRPSLHLKKRTISFNKTSCFFHKFCVSQTAHCHEFFFLAKKGNKKSTTLQLFFIYWYVSFNWRFP